MGGPRCGRTDGNQPAASDPASTQGILIPWDSEGLATPLQQIKRNGRLREGFRVLRCRILAGRGPTVSKMWNDFGRATEGSSTPENVLSSKD